MFFSLLLFFSDRFRFASLSVSPCIFFGYPCLSVFYNMFFFLRVVSLYIYPSIFMFVYRAFHKLPQIFTANHATFPIQTYAITVYIWVISKAPCMYLSYTLFSYRALPRPISLTVYLSFSI